MPLALAKPHPKRLRERATPAASPKVDPESGMLLGCLLCGLTSRNGRDYTEALETAAPLYDGVKVYAGHPRRDAMDEDRQLRDWVGIVQAARFVPGRGIVGDVRLRKAGPLFAEIIEAAQDFSTDVGFSHVADGDTRLDGDREIVEEIREVFSVDLVTNPATTRGMYESTQQLAPQARKELRELRDAVQRAGDGALKALDRAQRAGKAQPLTDAAAAVVQTAAAVVAWLSSPDRDHPGNNRQRIAELERIVGALTDVLGSPLRDGAFQRAEEVVDELNAFVEALGGSDVPPPDDDGGLEGITGESYAPRDPAAFAESLRDPTPPTFAESVRARAEAQRERDSAAIAAVDAAPTALDRRRLLGRLTHEQRRRYHNER